MEDEDDNGIKVTLIGDPAVGKTSIISRYTEDTFEEGKEATIGANFSEKSITINDKEVLLNLWDTAGQEKYQSLGKHFYKDSYIVLLVYDITSKESFNNLKEKWYPELTKHGEQFTVLALVGNKQDLFENDELVDKEEAQKYATEINATFYEVSAKTGEGIDKLFEELVTKYLQPEFKEKRKETLKNRGISFRFKANTQAEITEQIKPKKHKVCCKG